MEHKQWIERCGSAKLKEVFAQNGYQWQPLYQQERASVENGPIFKVGNYDNRFIPHEKPSAFALDYVKQYGGEVAYGYETVQIDPYSYIENGIGEVIVFRPKWLKDNAGADAVVFATIADLRNMGG